MFREMRRKKQLLSEEETEKILQSCTSGVLGVLGDDDYPYTVPVSYSYKDGKLFIHSAIQGHKIDSIKKYDKVSFCVIEKDDVQQETYTTHYRSVTIFGRARILSEDGEKRAALESLVKKYSPDHIPRGQQEIAREWERVCLIEVKSEHMTGKAAIEIINEKH
jgi:nitroimidazol reductase NimA-like FMN-containing flavoprotein (pyridoxamine 5'-phosphate oxidase superfamily)